MSISNLRNHPTIFLLALYQNRYQKTQNFMLILNLLIFCAKTLFLQN